MENGRHRPGPNLQHCSDSPNIFLYRFTSEKDQIDDWFLFGNGEDLVSLCPSGPGRFVSLRPVFRDPGLREFRNPHDKTFADRWYDEIDGMISSVQQRTRIHLLWPVRAGLKPARFRETWPTKNSHTTQKLQLQLHRKPIKCLRVLHLWSVYFVSTLSIAERD